MEDECDNKVAQRAIRSPFSTSLTEAMAQAGKAGLAGVLAHYQSQMGLPPGADGAAVAVFEAITRPFLMKRYEKFGVSVIERLILLEENVEGFRFENLIDNEQFATVIMQASLSAAATHHEEKHKALRNAVLNTAVGIAIDDEVQLLLLNFVDALLPIHMKLLKFLSNPKSFAQYPDPTPRLAGANDGASRAIDGAFPELQGKHYLSTALLQDLYNRGLSSIDFQHGEDAVFWGRELNSNVVQPKTTQLGFLFLQYITSPLNELFT